VPSEPLSHRLHHRDVEVVEHLGASHASIASALLDVHPVLVRVRELEFDVCSARIARPQDRQPEFTIVAN
jgi:hypothetical protein